MAKIEHLALWTEELDRLAGFYVTYFNASRGNKYSNVSKGFESRFLRFEGEARLEIMRSTTLEPAKCTRGTQRMGLTHFALAVGSEEQVDQLTSRLRHDGFEIIDGPRRTGDGYYESVVLDPDGNRVEITV